MLIRRRVFALMTLALCFGAACQSKQLERVDSEDVRPFFPIELGENPVAAEGLIACDHWEHAPGQMTCPQYRHELLSGAPGELVLKFREGRLVEGSWKRRDRWEPGQLNDVAFMLDRQLRDAFKDPYFENIDADGGDADLGAAIRRGEFHERWLLDDDTLLFFWIGLDDDGNHTLAVEIR